MDGAGFRGFKAEGFDFLRELRELQEKGEYEGARDFFIRNKQVYEQELKVPLGELVEEVSAKLKAKGVPLRGDRKNSPFRINRDVRFSPDKSPYKTHCGAVLSRGGTRKEQGVLYIHVDPAGCLMAAGFYRPEPGELARLREHVRKHPGKFRKMVQKLASHGITLDTDETLKRLPRGFEDVRDEDLAAAVKLKGYTVMVALERKDVMDGGVADRLAGFAKEVLPLLEFGWEALDSVE